MHLVVKNANFRFLLLNLIWADQLAYLTPIKASSGKEWQFVISIVKAHIGRSSGRSAWHIYPPQLNIDALHTITPNLQCIMGYILWDVFGSHLTTK